MDVLLFVILFLLITNWFQIKSFLGLVVGPKTKTHEIDGKWIKTVVEKKTGLVLPDITIFEDVKPYAMMAGWPWWPKMIVSEGMYKTFTKDELEWVILHEAAHCVLWHNVQAVVVEVLLLALGIYLISLGKMSFWIAAIILSLLCIQIIRWGIEYIADRYAIDRVDNLKGVISAQKKFTGKETIFGWNIDRSLRIQMAENRSKLFTQ